MVDAIILTGPTASGKSKAAIELARTLKGEIINADSMQLYRHLPILTACPTDADKTLISHHLYEILGDQDLGSAGWWYHEVCDLITQIRNQGRMPILVGGTGLYLHTLAHGLSEIPAVPEAVRLQAREFAEKDNFFSIVAQYDPIAAQKLHPSDKQRLTRALEVRLATGKSIYEWQAKTLKKANFTLAKFALLPDRAHVYANINQRFDQMMIDGALEEVRQLMQTPVRQDSPILRAVGAPELMASLRGELSQTEAIERAKQSSRNYAKRQYTWLRHQATDYTCFTEWSKSSLKTAVAAAKSLRN
ncbi:tRNA (adenosine(37)-N6)-dimethylallyltransferase MiaA [Candidatus Paracaedibacter symbiosus]|uniref:tRNA (adenosine(37)-N6)-dimethylallyltransferase MiaA n=1 Tax=Candidatus Paracaedibacter symbiosus TaxID=244582 RepID=UPI00068DEA47|nr:tRNA (adenosine(37)-N6)-dimethylallyltransferase MiaA [Candidatus Paracaedibacter symbiosus]